MREGGKEAWKHVGKGARRKKGKDVERKGNEEVRRKGIGEVWGVMRQGEGKVRRQRGTEVTSYQATR